MIGKRESFVQSRVNYVNAYCFAKFAECETESHGLGLDLACLNLACLNLWFS